MAMSDRIIMLDQGIIQQVASPTEIYRHPVNQFVADFVGKVNFFAGEAGNGKIELSEIGQSLPYDGQYKGKVIVAIRPENIILSPVHPASFPSGLLEGRLVSMFYLGDINDCRIEINGEILRVTAESSSFDTLKEGQKITAGIKEFLVYRN
jgi:iron(III) transport system ATP-binding protein